MKKSGVLEAALAVAFVLSMACEGAIGTHNASGSGATGGGPKPNDPGIIDQGGNTGTGTGGATVTGTGGTIGTVMPCTAGTPPATTRLFRLTHAPIRQLRARADRPRRPPGGRFPDRSEPGRLRPRHGPAGRRCARQGVPRRRRVAGGAGGGNATAFRKVVGCDPAGRRCLPDAFIASFGRRVFRRPLTDAEKTPLRDAVRARGDAGRRHRHSFQKGVQIVAAGDAAVAELHLPRRAVHAGERRPDPARRPRARQPPVFFPGQRSARRRAAGRGRAWASSATADGVAAQARRLIATDAAQARPCATSTTSGC